MQKPTYILERCTMCTVRRMFEWYDSWKPKLELTTSWDGPIVILVS